jgi:general secretion pathway protein G
LQAIRSGAAAAPINLATFTGRERLDRDTKSHIVSPAMRFLASTPVLRSRRSLPRAAQAAFTLLEILVVLGIIGLLVGLSVSKINGIFSSRQEDVAKMFVQSSLKASLFAYKLDVGDYPSTAEGLQALLVAPAGKGDRWRRAYIDSPTGKPPLDPWGHEYQYAYPGTKNKGDYDLWSMGPDGQNGTADDIGNWPPPAEGEAPK